jgi:hypothetical protein
VTVLERVAREIGIALGECGAEESSTLVGELADELSGLARERSSREGRRQGPRRPSRRRTASGAV